MPERHAKAQGSGNIRELENRSKRQWSSQRETGSTLGHGLRGRPSKDPTAAEAKEISSVVSTDIAVNDGNNQNTEIWAWTQEPLRHLEKKKEEGTPEKTIGALLD